MRRFGEGIKGHGQYVLHYKGEIPEMYGVRFLIKKCITDKLEEIKGISKGIAIFFEIPLIFSILSRAISMSNNYKVFLHKFFEY